MGNRGGIEGESRGNRRGIEGESRGNRGGIEGESKGNRRGIEGESRGNQRGIGGESRVNRRGIEEAASWLTGLANPAGLASPADRRSQAGCLADPERQHGSVRPTECRLWPSRPSGQPGQTARRPSQPIWLSQLSWLAQPCRPAGLASPDVPAISYIWYSYIL